MQLTIEIEREDDCRWIGEVLEVPGALSYGSTREEAASSALALAFRVLAEQLLEQTSGDRDDPATARFAQIELE